MSSRRASGKRNGVADHGIACLRLAETVTDFLARLRSLAGTLDVSERQHVLRLLVKHILVGSA
jgi:hypothetical protein